MPAILLSAWAWFTGTRAGQVCLAIAAAGLALLGLRSHWRGQGKAEEQQAARDESLKRHEERADVEDEVARMPDAAVRDELRKWSRPE